MLKRARYAVSRFDPLRRGRFVSDGCVIVETAEICGFALVLPGVLDAMPRIVRIAVKQ